MSYTKYIPFELCVFVSIENMGKWVIFGMNSYFRSMFFGLVRVYLFPKKIKRKSDGSG